MPCPRMTSLCAALWLPLLTACGTPPPVMVPEPKVIRLKPPAALTARVDPASIPTVVTYKDVAEIGTIDRSALAICNGRLEEIEALGKEEP